MSTSHSTSKRISVPFAVTPEERAELRRLFDACHAARVAAIVRLHNLPAGTLVKAGGNDLSVSWESRA